MSLSTVSRVDNLAVPIQAANTNMTEGMLPPQFFDDEAFREPEYGPERTCVIALFLAKLMKKLSCEFKRENYAAFDANPADCGCQNRALLLRDIHCRCRDPLLKEVKALTERLFEKEKCRGSPRGLFGKWMRDSNAGMLSEAKAKEVRATLRALPLSSDLTFLAHCFLSKIMRAIKSINLENGVVTTESCVNGLASVEKKMNTPLMDSLPHDRRAQILQFNQEALSALTAERIYQIARSKEETAVQHLTSKMLSSDHRVVFAADNAYRPKTFTCLFFSMQAVLQELKSQKAMICFEEIVSKAKRGKPIRLPFRVFLTFSEKTQDFEVVDPPKPDLEIPIPVVVLTAVMQEENHFLSEAEVIARLAQSSFSVSRFLLAQAACGSPYQHGSSLDEVTCKSAREQIEEYRAVAAEPFMQLDHFYFCLSDHLVDKPLELKRKKAPDVV